MYGRSNMLGWITLLLSTAIGSFWGFWGALENFHEGWWMPSLGARLLWTSAYLGPMLVTVSLGAVAVRWPRAGAVSWASLGIAFTGFIFIGHWGHLTAVAMLSWLPLTAMPIAVGGMWWFGRPRPRRFALLLVIGLPVLTALVFGAEPAWRVSQRRDDEIRTERRVEGNGVTLLWAPTGPGWVLDARHACSWSEAMDRCARLSVDGARLEEVPVNFWRLPTVSEAVGSMTRGGRNAGGQWDAASATASYRIKPDKESPLWVVYAETIYWWTSTEVGQVEAYRVVYDGRVDALPRTLRMGTLGFRAVRDPVRDPGAQGR